MNNTRGHEPVTPSELDVNGSSIRAFAIEPALHSEGELTTLRGTSAMNSTSRTGYEIRFRSLFNEGRALTFPCDAKGHVELDALSEKARNNYLYARAVVGREYAAPAIMLADLH